MKQCEHLDTYYADITSKLDDVRNKIKKSRKRIERLSLNIENEEEKIITLRVFEKQLIKQFMDSISKESDMTNAVTTN